MLTYARIKRNRRKFLSLTGLTPKEFKGLLPAFEQAYRRLHPPDQTQAGKPRQRKLGGGRKSVLASFEQKLLFVLVYQKAYPLQTLLGELFTMSQPGVNYWIHHLLPVLKEALDIMEAIPERNPRRFSRTEKRLADAPEFIIDGTERRRQRPKNQEKQRLYYSGKKKAHSDKNVVIVQAQTKRVGFLSQTYTGKTHDKKIADEESICYPRDAVLHKDTGFQGYEPAVQQTCQPKKKRGMELTAKEKRNNRKLSRIRVKVEHALAGVKRSRIVKDVFRNTKEGSSDLVMVVACGLHNLRVEHRKRPLKS